MMTRATTTTTTSPTAIHVNGPAGRPPRAGAFFGVGRWLSLPVGFAATLLLVELEATKTCMDAVVVDIAAGGEAMKFAAMAENIAPRPAATVLTLRDARNGYEILMLRRNVRSEFMGGAYVFPAVPSARTTIRKLLTD